MTKHDSNALSARRGGGDRGGASANQNETPPTRTLRLPERCPPLDRFMALDPAPEQTRGDEDNQQVTEDYAGMSLELLVSEEASNFLVSLCVPNHISHAYRDMATLRTSGITQPTRHDTAMGRR
jgi:hypothetical protein